MSRTDAALCFRKYVRTVDAGPRCLQVSIIEKQSKNVCNSYERLERVWLVESEGSWLEKHGENVKRSCGFIAVLARGQKSGR